jgi:hypothetical protein
MRIFASYVECEPGSKENERPVESSAGRLLWNNGLILSGLTALSAKKGITFFT